MNSHDRFFLIFLLTIVVVRFFVYLKPIPSPTVKGFRIHHYMYGLALIIIAIPFKSLAIYAIGLGLSIDELTYILIGGKSHGDNYSKASIIGTIILVITVFFFRTFITPAW